MSKNSNFNSDVSVNPNGSNPVASSNPIDSKANFEEIKKRFEAADIDEKIRIYTTTSGLSVEQFKQLLRLFPLQHLDRLERAMEEAS